jgi:hypothetical protein
MMRIFNSPDTELQASFLASLLATTAEEWSVDRTGVVATEFHGITSWGPAEIVGDWTGNRGRSGQALANAESW